MYHKIFIIIALLMIPELSSAKSCKKYTSCAEVIFDYPNGNFKGKDRDKDGIPCENVCHSKQEVEKLLERMQKKKILN